MARGWQAFKYNISPLKIYHILSRFSSICDDLVSTLVRFWTLLFLFWYLLWFDFGHFCFCFGHFCLCWSFLSVLVNGRWVKRILRSAATQKWLFSVEAKILENDSGQRCLSVLCYHSFFMGWDHFARSFDDKISLLESVKIYNLALSVQISAFCHSVILYYSNST